MIFFLMIWSMSSLGMFALACSMSKHQKQIFARELDAAQTKQAAAAGWVLLTTAAAICICSGALSNMLSYWIGALSFAALFCGLCLSYAEGKIKKISAVLALTAMLTGLIGLL